jgi:putative transposase
MRQTTETAMPVLLGNGAGFDLIEDRLRQNIRATIEALFEEELTGIMHQGLAGVGQATDLT